ncbi:GspH/FimT family pseudopilin [Cupriavidus necator]|uniref:Type II secretion system protein H n=1 Tax=Cupriavidus necator TaxID=106590 RepID=A0A367PPE6_CUPNE|nr:GspH/FimT family pseudopilin [Cupriavidus necator]QQX84805.1 GspH/FimT family pseudopilin [Cupriavidus necator]RCJ08875.1 prepilin-type N-terminal cleavage/methylation domain-containing protein [Cupriavidus necator]
MSAYRKFSGQGLSTRQWRGFTLIELMATVAIAAILMSVGTPYFREFVLGSRIRAAADDLMSTLVYARSEAIKRNADVTVAPEAGGWKNGWTVTAGAAVLSRHEAMSELTVSGPAGGLSYNSNGRLAALAAPFGISVSGSTATPYCVSINLSGMPTSQRGGC